MAEVSDMLGEFDEIVNSAKAELTAEEKAIAKVCQERLKKIKDLKSMVEKALGLAERFL